jgi:hypothetical protein
MTVYSFTPSRIGTIITRFSKSVGRTGVLNPGVKSSAGIFVSCANPLPTQTSIRTTNAMNPVILFMPSFLPASLPRGKH